MIAQLVALVATSTSAAPLPAGAMQPAATCNVHYANTRTFAIPGRGLTLSWAPPGSRVAGGHAIAVGGHLVGAQTYLPNGERYDTKVYDTSSGQYLKRFGAHYWWAIANTWSIDPFLGEVIADGGGDHAVKLFLADRPGTNLGPLQTPGVRGRYAVEDGAIPAIKAVYGQRAPGLDQINAWITALAFSPDGAYLAGASKDGTIRVWQTTDRVHPEDRFRVVKVYYPRDLGPVLSVRWSPDGTMLAAGSKTGTVALYAFDALRTRWDEGMIAEFAGVTFRAELGWLESHRAATNAAGAPAIDDVGRWRRTGLGAVWNVRYSPDGRWLAAAATRSTVFDLAAGTDTPLMSDGYGLDFSPDGRFLAVGGGDARVHLFAATGARPAFVPYDHLQGHAEPVVGAVAWSPDGSTLASVAGGPLLGQGAFDRDVEGGDDHVRLWTPRTGGGEPCLRPTTTTTVSSTSTSTAASTSTSIASSTSTTTVAGGSTTTTTSGSTTTTTVPGDVSGPYPGFGHHTTGGAGHPTFIVTNSADGGGGSLRDALALAEKAGGGIIRFAVTDGGDLHPGPNLVVPANTTVDAIGSHITLWGGSEGYGDGLLNVWNGNVIVVGLRFRNALNDGLEISPKNPQRVDVANVVVDRCSFTGNADGAIDVTGHARHAVHDVTIMRDLIAGTGRYCAKGHCGGGSLFKYGATNGSYYANHFFANLERAPLISGAGAAVPVVADLRYNLVEWTASSSMSIRARASANVVGNYFFGPTDGARVWSGGLAFFGGGNTNQDPDPRRELAAPLSVPALPDPSTLADALQAGAQPRDAIDACYLAIAQPSFGHFRNARCTPGP